jgi:hypothetical protein
MLLDPGQAEGCIVASEDGGVARLDRLLTDGREYIPYSADNNLLTHRVVLLPSAVGSYDSKRSLVADVRSFIRKYVDLSDAFEEIAAHYVLLTWLYDEFSELPYLRVRGDYGSGKSRFLLTVGSLCWKPIFASGASTISPIFRLIDQIGGALVVDEADFWASDERAEIVKILNNGNARGFPVLRSEVTPSKEFNPRAFDIYGPKLVATRHQFEDEALESRCLTEILGTRPLRSDIPISLPPEFHAEAEALRNKLLRYRFDWLSEPEQADILPDLDLEPRRAQILAPLLSIADEDARIRMRAFVDAGNPRGRDRTYDAERRVLSAVKGVMAKAGTPLTISAITEEFGSTWGDEYGGVVAHRWIGTVLRRLGLSPEKSNGTYKVPLTDLGRLRELFDRYNLGDVGDFGDVKSHQ